MVLLIIFGEINSHRKGTGEDRNRRPVQKQSKLKEQLQEKMEFRNKKR